MSRPSRQALSARRRSFAALVVACVIAAIGSVVSAVSGGGPAVTSGGAEDALVAARGERRALLVVRDLDRAQPQRFGQVAVAPLRPGAARTLVALRCDRVSFDAGVGLCLALGRGLAPGYHVRAFGADLRTHGDVKVDGVPSRARVSPDGRLGAVTMFVGGHSYADVGAFSTTTTIVDLRHGTKVATLEDFTVTRDGRRITSPDVNYWGVTFARGHDRFYATLSTGGRFYLVVGSISARRMTTIHDGVECPSVSADGRRIVFKRRVGPGGKRWRLYVLNVETMRETPLAETRSVDDQAEWIDADHVLYALDEDIWTVPADGSGRPTLYARHADSPAVVRW